MTKIRRASEKEGGWNEWVRRVFEAMRSGVYSEGQRFPIW